VKPIVIRLWITMAVGAACVAAGLGFAVAKASGAIGGAATTLGLIALAGFREFRKHRAQGARHPQREPQRAVGGRFLLLASVGGCLTVATGIAWLVTEHAPGGGILIGVGLCLGLAPLALDRYLQFLRGSGRRH
jgi:hypothetical protein